MDPIAAQIIELARPLKDKAIYAIASVTKDGQVRVRPLQTPPPRDLLEEGELYYGYVMFSYTDDSLTHEAIGMESYYLPKYNDFDTGEVIFLFDYKGSYDDENLAIGFPDNIYLCDQSGSELNFPLCSSLTVVNCSYERLTLNIREVLNLVDCQIGELTISSPDNCTVVVDNTSQVTVINPASSITSLTLRGQVYEVGRQLRLTHLNIETQSLRYHPLCPKLTNLTNTDPSLDVLLVKVGGNYKALSEQYPMIFSKLVTLPE